MKIVITGGTGWIGRTLVPMLVESGHDVVGVTRSPSSAGLLESMGATSVAGDLGDPASLASAARGADGVIHLAFRHDFDNFAAAIAEEGCAVAALGEALAGSGAALVVASGTPALPGQVSTENDDAAPGSAAEGRDLNARAVIDLAARGVRSSVVRLPRSVHGAGDSHGFVSWLAATARTERLSGYVGDGAQRWPVVHVRDAARLFQYAVESAPAGSILHAVGEEGVTMRTQLTQASTGWRPTEPTLLEDIAAGHYDG